MPSCDYINPLWENFPSKLPTRSIIIEAQVEAAHEAVRALMLCDEEQVRFDAAYYVLRTDERPFSRFSLEDHMLARAAFHSLAVEAKDPVIRFRSAKLLLNIELENSLDWGTHP